jgi:hypothetical protein
MLSELTSHVQMAAQRAVSSHVAAEGGPFLLEVREQGPHAVRLPSRGAPAQ